MGRGRSGLVNQSEKKINKRHTEHRNDIVWFGSEMTKKPPPVDFSEEFLNQLKKMNPRDVANILVNT